MSITSLRIKVQEYWCDTVKRQRCCHDAFTSLPVSRCMYMYVWCGIQLTHFRDWGQRWFFFVTLHLFRRALADAIARDLSLHKRSRLHFGRGSRVEAARVAEDAKNHYESGGCSNGDGFSARHSSREHGYYEQFRGFREVDLNGTMSNYLRLSLLVLTYFLHFPSPEYVNMIKRLHVCRKLLYRY